LKRKTPLRSRTPLRVRRGPNRLWRQVRREVESRANGRCEARVPDVCDIKGVHAHHLLRRSQGGVDDPSNLAWLCAQCHRHIHANPAWSYEHGWLIRRSAA
jgi:hypothetical protein